jgi:hypothetical protein
MIRGGKLKITMKFRNSITTLLAVAAMLTSFSIQSTFAADDQKPEPKSAQVDSSRLSPELLGVAKLLQAGLGEKVIMTYLKNAPPRKNPTAEELVYLHELGLSNEGMVALMNAVPKASLAQSASAPASAVQSPPNQQTPVSVQPVAPAPAQSAPPSTSQVISSAPAVVYTQPAPATIYVERPPVVTYVQPYPRFSFGFDLGHHVFGHHGHHFGGHHGGHHSSHHSGGHHGGHH